MMKKIYQADFLLLPEHEFWHMYVLLRKGKDFYYECAGRSTEKPPDAKGFYDYKHACFTLGVKNSVRDGRIPNRP